eukprot:2136859-Rhodomonas_salina.1
MCIRDRYLRLCGRQPAPESAADVSLSPPSLFSLFPLSPSLLLPPSPSPPPAVYEAAWRHEPEQAKALAKEVLEGEEEEEGGEEEGEEGEAKEGAVRSVKQAKKRERRADNHNTRCPTALLSFAADR